MSDTYRYLHWYETIHRNNADKMDNTNDNEWHIQIFTLIWHHTQKYCWQDGQYQLQWMTHTDIYIDMKPYTEILLTRLTIPTTMSDTYRYLHWYDTIHRNIADKMDKTCPCTTNLPPVGQWHAINVTLVSWVFPLGGTRGMVDKIGFVGSINTAFPSGRQWLGIRVGRGYRPSSSCARDVRAASSHRHRATHITTSSPIT